LLLKKQFFWGFTIAALIALQAGASYYSVNSFLEGNLLRGFLFFFLIPIMGLLWGFYFVRFRRKGMAKPLK
jgi:membrane-bound acyltransferase YfiQ involved in biofilm formation